MKKLFLGKPIHWAMIVAVVAALYWLGAKRFHLLEYNTFLFMLLGIAVGCVVLVVATYREGDRVTRDSLDEEELKVPGGD